MSLCVAAYGGRIQRPRCLDGITSEDVMSDERWMRKNLEGGSRDLMVVPSRHFPGRTEKLNENPHSEYQVFRMGFEASTFRI